MPDGFFAQPRTTPADTNRTVSITPICSLCRGSTLLPDVQPLYPPSEELPPNLTCADWERIAASGDLLKPGDCEAIQNGFYVACCEGTIPQYRCETNIRNALLEDYDTAVPPVTSPRHPLNVTVKLEYQFVESVDVQQGTAEIFFSIFLLWKDDRLKWEVGPETCANYITAFASHMDPEATQVWVPDLDLYNQIEGVGQLPESMVVAYSDGTVTWSRNGGLKAFCQFSGLAQIPFDVLGCQLIVGPWVRLDPTQIQYNLWNGTGLTYGDFHSVYSEYLPVPDMAETGYGYGGSIMFFNLFFKRSQNYYVWNLIVPTIILTYVSMGTFLLDLRVGERLSYGMALALVVVAQQINTSGLIPVSNERLWIDKFIGWSFYWVIVGLLESVFVGYIYFLREDMHAKITNEEEKRTKIYDGVDQSALMASNTSPPETVAVAAAEAAATNGSHQEEAEPIVVPEKERQSTVSFQDDTNGDPKNDATSQPQQHGEEEEISIPPLTFKQQLKATAVSSQPTTTQKAPPKKTLSRTLTKRDLSQHCKVGKYWRWMYTISLRALDRFFFFFTLVTYSLFLMAMFASIQYWGMNTNTEFLINEHTTKLQRPDDIRGAT